MREVGSAPASRTAAMSKTLFPFVIELLDLGLGQTVVIDTNVVNQAVPETVPHLGVPPELQAHVIRIDRAPGFLGGIQGPST